MAKIINGIEKVDSIILDDMSGYADSMSVERQSLTVVVSTTHVYLDVEAIGGGDISYWLEGVKRSLDCTTGDGVGGKARVELPQGTATLPVRSFVSVIYDEQNSKLILVSSVNHPTGAFSPVAVVAVQDYSTVSANGALVYQRTTEAVEHNEKGAISWMREKLRAIGAVYWSGIDPIIDITTNGGAEDNINFTVTNGEVFQLHRQSFPSYDISSDGIYVTNVSGDGTLTNYEKITDLNSIHEIADGTALSDGDSINLCIWGSINYSDGDCKLFVNLPEGKYSVDADAVSDSDVTIMKKIPAQFRTTGFLIARLVLKYNTAASGTWSNLLTDTVSTWLSETKDQGSVNYPSNYPNNQDNIYTFTKAGAAAVRLHFDAFKTESNYDFATVRNGSDAFPADIAARRVDPLSYHGNLGSFTSAEITGTTIRVNETSDGSVQRTGWHVDALEYRMDSVSGAEIDDLRGQTYGIKFD